MTDTRTDMDRKDKDNDMVDDSTDLATAITLVTLPPEVLEMILCLLDGRSFHRLAQTCSQLRDVVYGLSHSESLRFKLWEKWCFTEMNERMREEVLLRYPHTDERIWREMYLSWQKRSYVKQLGSSQTVTCFLKEEHDPQQIITCTIITGEYVLVGYDIGKVDLFQLEGEYIETVYDERDIRPVCFGLLNMVWPEPKPWLHWNRQCVKWANDVHDMLIIGGFDGDVVGCMLLPGTVKFRLTLRRLMSKFSGPFTASIPIREAHTVLQIVTTPRDSIVAAYTDTGDLLDVWDVFPQFQNKKIVISTTQLNRTSNRYKKIVHFASSYRSIEPNQARNTNWENASNRLSFASTLGVIADTVMGDSSVLVIDTKKERFNLNFDGLTNITALTVVGDLVCVGTREGKLCVFWMNGAVNGVSSTMIVDIKLPITHVSAFLSKRGPIFLVSTQAPLLVVGFCDVENDAE